MAEPALTVDIPEKLQFLYEPSRYKIMYGGRGGAKSWGVADALIIQGYERPLRILCAREVQNSIRQSVHHLLKQQIQALNMGAFYSVTDTAIRGIPRAGGEHTEFFFHGLWNNTDSVKSVEGVDICWVEEAQSVSDLSWRTLIPTIRKPGSEIWITFNPNLPTDATWRRFVLHPPKGARVVEIGWEDNPWFPDELAAEREHDYEVDEDTARHVWEGELRLYAEGAIYGKQLRAANDENRVGRVAWTPALEVQTFWDLGRGDHTSIWFMQRVGAEHRFIRYYENRLVDIDHYVAILREYSEEHGYTYGTHYMPHDVDVSVLGMRNKTRREIFEEAGVRPIDVVQRIDSIETGIELTRRAFPSCYFDEEGCVEGLSALSNYQYVYDEEFDRHRRTPLHNWASNGADAFRQFAQGYHGYTGWGVLADTNEPKSARRKKIVSKRLRQPTDWRI